MHRHLNRPDTGVGIGVGVVVFNGQQCGLVICCGTVAGESHRLICTIATEGNVTQAAVINPARQGCVDGLISGAKGIVQRGVAVHHQLGGGQNISVVHNTYAQAAVKQRNGRAAWIEYSIVIDTYCHTVQVDLRPVSGTSDRDDDILRCHAAVSVINSHGIGGGDRFTSCQRVKSRVGGTKVPCLCTGAGTRAVDLGAERQGAV